MKKEKANPADLMKRKAPLWSFYLLFFLAAVVGWLVSMILIALVSGFQGLRDYFLASVLVSSGLWFCFSASVTAIWVLKRADIETILYDPIEDMTVDEYEILLQTEREKRGKAVKETLAPKTT